MRLPYAPSTPPEGETPEASKETQETAEIYTRISTRRHPRPLIPLDLTLLHSPPVADGWNSFLGAIRSRTVLDKGLLELAVCRVAVLNGAVYEWNAHAPLALKGGVEGRQLQDVRGVACTCPSSASALTSNQSRGESQGRTGTETESGEDDVLGKTSLTAPQKAVLLYTDAMTRNITVPDPLFERLKTEGFTDREIVELTATIAGYNCVSRFLVALDVGENNDKEMKGVEELVRSLS